MILKTQDQVKKLELSHFKTYYKAIGIRMELNGTEQSPEINQLTSSQLILNKRCRHNSMGERTVLLTNGSERTRYP